MGPADPRWGPQAKPGFHFPPGSTSFSAAQWRKRKTQEAYKPQFKFRFTCDQLHVPEQVKSFFNFKMRKIILYIHK